MVAKKLTPEHIRKIKQTYHKKKIDELHSKIMQKYWQNPRHKFHTRAYRKKLALAKLGEKNPMYQKALK